MIFAEPMLRPVAPFVPGPARAVPPFPVSSFVGRHADRAVVMSLISDHRLVTLTGPGGIGKTRLAIELGLSGDLDDFGAMAWVDLSTTADAGAVEGALLGAFDLARGPEATATELLVAHLRDRRAMLLIDNCEQVAEVVAQRVQQLLHNCPDLRVMATSRVPLGVDGEATWSVPPLSLPESETRIRGDAVALFLARARSATGKLTLTRADRGIVGAVCRALEGIPLAIELAAGQLRTSSLAEIHQRLDSQLSALVGGSRFNLERHRTVRASIDWSHALLTRREQILFRRLSVFAGGWDVESMRAVCGGRGLQTDELAAVLDQLVLKSLVSADRNGRTSRYTLLESVREYARERLAASNELAQVAERHVAWAVARAAQADREHWAIDTRRRAFFDRDAPNFVAALEWTCATGSCVALDLVGPLATYWRELGAFEHAATAVARVLEATPMEPSAGRAYALMWQGCLDFHRGDFSSATERLSQCERVLAHTSSARTEAWLAGLRATVLSVMDPRAGEELLERACSLAVVADDQALLSYLLVPLLIGHSCRDDADGVRRIARRIRILSREVRHQLPQRWAVWSLARNALLAGDLQVCRAQLARAWELSERRDAEAACGTAALQALCLVYSGQLDVAEERAGVARDLVRGGRYWRGAANVSVAMGFLALAWGDLDAARRLGNELAGTEGAGAHIPVHGYELQLIAGLASAESIAVRQSAAALNALAVRFANRRAAALARYGAAAAALLSGDPEQAVGRCIEALQLELAGGWRPAVIDSLELLAAAEHALGHADRADVLYASASNARLDLGLVPVVRSSFPTSTRVVSAFVSLDDAVAYACDRRSPTSNTQTQGLTRSEQAVAELASAGLSNPAIAAQLVCSRATVKTHLLHIYSKLGVNNRTELARLLLSHASNRAVPSLSPHTPESG